MHEVIVRIKEKLRCIRLSDDYQEFPTEQFEDGLVKAKNFFKGNESPKVTKASHGINKGLCQTEQ